MYVRFAVNIAAKSFVRVAGVLSQTVGFEGKLLGTLRIHTIEGKIEAKWQEKQKEIVKE